MIRVWFFHACIPWPSLVLSALCPWVTTFLLLFIFRANSLAPFDVHVLFMSNCLPISLLKHLGTQSQGKMGHDHSVFFRLYRGVMGLWAPFACFFVRVNLWREMRVHGMIRWFVSALSLGWSEDSLVVLPLGDLLYSRRNKLNKKVKDTWPKDWEKQKSSRGARQENQD